MRVVALEEHVTFPALAKTIDPAAIAARGLARIGERVGWA
mgnify:CR=1 FL=1